MMVRVEFTPTHFAPDGATFLTRVPCVGEYITRPETGAAWIVERVTHIINAMDATRDGPIVAYVRVVPA